MRPNIFNENQFFKLSCLDINSNGDSTDQDFDITADMMVHDIDDETTLEEEELNEDSEYAADELAELEKVQSYKILHKSSTLPMIAIYCII